MRTIIYAIISIVIISFAVGCKSKVTYVPVESVKTEYRDVLQRDSVRLYDSIYVREKGDTVMIERYRYLYRDKLIRDSVLIRDSIAVPYPVVEYKEVNCLTGWQNFQVWCGRGLMALMGIGLFYLLLRWKWSF